MSSEVVGTCFVCGKVVTRHMLSHKKEGEDFPEAVFYNGWPKSGLACTNHSGIIKEYKATLGRAEKELQGVISGTPTLKNRDP